MLSNDELWPSLARQFVAVRLDWEQGNHYRDKFGFVLGTGDQLFLEAGGESIPPRGGRKVYGRHGEDTTPEVVARVRREAGGKAEITTLDLEWFFWLRKQSAKRALRGSPGSHLPAPR